MEFEFCQDNFIWVTSHCQKSTLYIQLADIPLLYCSYALHSDAVHYIYFCSFLASSKQMQMAAMSARSTPGAQVT